MTEKSRLRLLRGLPDRLFPGSNAARHQGVRLVIFLAWLALVTLLVAHHVMWRDEVRAFSLAMQGQSILDMPAAARGYGHPLSWHVLLRLGHDLFGTRLVLPGIAFAVGVAAAGILVFVARLSLPVMILTLFGGFATYDYVVMARNYGLAMLLMFLVAWIYSRSRERSVALDLALGGLLFLLCNATVHAVILAGAFAIFWLGDLIAREGWRWSRAKWSWLIAVILLGAGALLSFVSVYPSVEDAPAVAHRTLNETLLHLVPGMEFQRIFGNFNATLPVTILAAVLVTGSVLAFTRRPAALIAAIAALGGLQLLFVFVYPGHYRHDALLIVFFVVLHWLTAQGYGGLYDTPLARRLEGIGQVTFLALLVAQLPATARAVVQAVRTQPQGEAKALVELLAQHGLARSTVIADPDYLIESLRYYGANPTWSVRSGRLTSLVPMKLAESAPMTPARLLATARNLVATTRRPVVVLVTAPLDDAKPRQVIDRGTFGPLVLDPVEIAKFLAATTKLATLRAASGDEVYDVYVLRAGSASECLRGCNSSVRPRIAP
jgi:MFS family permease